MRSAAQLAFFAKQLKAAGYKTDCPPCTDKNMARRIAKAKKRRLVLAKGRAKVREWEDNHRGNRDSMVARIFGKAAADEAKALNAAKGKKVKGYAPYKKLSFKKKKNEMAFNPEHRQKQHESPFVKEREWASQRI